MSNDSGSKSPADSGSPQDDDARRNFLAAVGSVVLGALLGIVPTVIGIFSFFNPLARRPDVPDAYDDGSQAAEGMIGVCSLDALTVDGPPQRFEVIDNQIDAWNFTPQQPIGAVYIQRLAGDELRVFNTTCPHAGCSVSSDGNAFNCPCHNSSFELDGSKRTAESGRENPSPRGLDTLEYEVKDGNVLVAFQNFYTGREHKVPKA